MGQEDDEPDEGEEAEMRAGEDRVQEQEENIKERAQKDDPPGPARRSCSRLSLSSKVRSASSMGFSDFRRDDIALGRGAE